MKHISHSLALAGMLALALSACSTMHGWGSSRSGTTTSGGESGTGTGAGSSSGTSGASGSSQSGSGYEQNNSSGSSGTSGTSSGGTASMGESGAAAMGGTAAGQDRSQSASAASISPNATVVSIDVVPRQASSEGDSGTAGAVGSSAAGATGMSAGGDRVYRITARMDDGSTRVVTQESTPDFRAGDRVNLSNGIIAH